MSYRSVWEKNVAKELKRLRFKFTYETETFEYHFPIRAVCDSCGSNSVSRRRNYTPDFFLSNGTILEVKGRFTADDRKKLACMKEQYPDLDIRIVFLRDNKLSRNAKKTYSQWCDSKGIDYCVGLPERDWLKGGRRAARRNIR